MAFGIAFDIGAYSCKAALLRGESEQPTPLLNGENILRSVAYVDNQNRIFVGWNAIKRASADPHRAFFNIKRRILQGDINLPGIDGLTYVDLYIALIKEVLTRCQAQLYKAKDTIDHIVLTIPSYPEERAGIIAEMKRAAESIEISPGKKLAVDLLIEPAGAAIHNLDNHNRKNKTSKMHTQIIYDLGHSTLDVALVSTTRKDGEYSNTLHYFRPDDETFCEYFEGCIAQEIHKKLSAEGVTISNRLRLRIDEAARELKHELSNLDEHTVAITYDDGDETYFTLSRNRFEDLIVTRLRDSATLVSEAMDVAASKGIQVDEIVLAGGGSSIPLVEQCVREVAKNIPIRRSLQPIDAISYGASRYCLTHNLLQRSEFAYGIQLPVKIGTLNSEVMIVAPKDTPLPYKSPQLRNPQFKCTPDGVFYTTLYAYDSTSTEKTVPTNDCIQIRHMTFTASPNQRLSFFMEIDEEHCVKIICQTDSKQRYIMTSFDPANAEPRKE